MLTVSPKQTRAAGEPPPVSDFQAAMSRIASSFDKMVASYISPSPRDFAEIQKLPAGDPLRVFFERHEGFAADGDRRLDAEERASFRQLEVLALRHKRMGI